MNKNAISALVGLLGYGLIFYGLFGEPGVLALGLMLPLLAGVAFRLVVLSRLVKFFDESLKSITIFHCLFFGLSLSWDARHFPDDRAHWPEVFYAGLLGTYIIIGTLVYYHDVRALKRSRPDSGGGSPTTDKNSGKATCGRGCAVLLFSAMALGLFADLVDGKAGRANPQAGVEASATPSNIVGPSIRRTQEPSTGRWTEDEAKFSIDFPKGYYPNTDIKQRFNLLDGISNQLEVRDALQEANVAFVLYRNPPGSDGFNPVLSCLIAPLNPQFQFKPDVHMAMILKALAEALAKQQPTGAISGPETITLGKNTFVKCSIVIKDPRLSSVQGLYLFLDEAGRRLFIFTSATPETDGDSVAETFEDVMASLESGSPSGSE